MEPEVAFDIHNAASFPILSLLLWTCCNRWNKPSTRQDSKQLSISALEQNDNRLFS
jgi:hypothetical protein